MNKLSKLLILFVVIAMLAGCLAACGTPSEGNNNVGGNGNENGGNNGGDNTGDNTGDNNDNNNNEQIEFVDYAALLKFDPDSGKNWARVTVKSYIDGDTTHFTPIDGTKIGDLDYVKARYLGINTPESTGVIEPWGKKAANYTETQLRKATDIIIESDTDKWDRDSTGDRYLLWVWYRTSENEDYRNLNIEILQQGLAYGSGTSSNTYAEYTTAALYQANTLKLYVFNRQQKDPDYYYGSAINLTLKELKASITWDADADNGNGGKGRFVSPYDGKLVKFEAVVAKQSGYTIYVEEYDAQNNMYFGMQIFTGYGYPRMSDFEIGNRVSIVGTLQYYKQGGTFQVSNLQFDILFPDWEGGCQVIGKGYEASYRETDVNTIMNGKITLETYVTENDEEVLKYVEYDYGELAHYSTVSLKNLTVQSVYVTSNGGDSDGALTITCKDANNKIIKIRTADQLVRDDQTIVVKADFPAGTVISVRGIIDSFDGDYQIKVFNINDIIYE